MTSISLFLTVVATIFSLEACLILWLTLMPRFGYLGKTISEACTRAPWLDLTLAALIWLPWLVSALVAGWLGFVATLVGQIAAMQMWILLHELSHRQDTPNSRIVHFLNKQVGWWRNYLGLWVSTLAFPVLLSIRFAEILIYPLLVWLLGFPTYKHSDWVNVSRHKFSGLVGHDLIWCWYCDWMTGVYSLGAEMLRNVESFWCPIRFYDGKKCENCKLDFPDLEGGWVAADGTMDDVVELMECKHGGQHHSWFGHRERHSQ